MAGADHVHTIAPPTFWSIAAAPKQTKMKNARRRDDAYLKAGDASCLIDIPGAELQFVFRLRLACARNRGRSPETSFGHVTAINSRRRARLSKLDWIVSMTFGAVVVGRNEGERLKRGLQALTSADLVVYVDSGSTDGSPDWAKAHGVEVVELDMSRPFTAARARNAGFARLRECAPDLRYVQFVDGDCEIVASWPERAIEFLDINDGIAAVCGRRRERWPDRSIYNWLCDQEWDGPSGETQAFGGDVMMRVDAFVQVNGYCETLIAGEDPELGVRLRAAGWRLWRLEGDMTLHDAAMTRFGQWWLRVVRSGYAFAEGAQMHGRSPARHWVWESRRAWIWGVWVPLVCAIISVAASPWGWLIWMIYPIQVLRQTLRNDGPLRQRATMATFQMLARFPEALGQLKYFRDRAFGFQARLIEYK